MGRGDSQLTSCVLCPCKADHWKFFNLVKNLVKNLNTHSGKLRVHIVPFSLQPQVMYVLRYRVTKSNSTMNTAASILGCSDSVLYGIGESQLLRAFELSNIRISLPNPKMMQTQFREQVATDFISGKFGITAKCNCEFSLAQIM